MNESPTKTSHFLKFLVTTCVIPVTVKNGKIVFNVFSVKTFVYFIVFGGWLFFTFYVLYLGGYFDIFDSQTVINQLGMPSL